MKTKITTSHDRITIKVENEHGNVTLRFNRYSVTMASKNKPNDVSREIIREKVKLMDEAYKVASKSEASYGEQARMIAEKMAA